MSSVLEQARAVVEQYQGAECRLDGNSIYVQSSSSQGFQVSLTDEDYQITLGYGNWHYPFDDSQQALDVFEKCLSGKARIMEIARLGFPYKGVLEIIDRGASEPIPFFETGLIHILAILPFPKKLRFYQNAYQKFA